MARCGFFTVLKVGAAAVVAVLAAVSSPGAERTSVVAAPPNDDTADFAFGGPTGFTTDLCNNGGSVSRNYLCDPTGAVWDEQGNLYITDGGNGRVLEYDSPLTTDHVPDRVFGKPDFTTGQDPSGPGLCPAPTASLLCFPGGLALDAAGNLYVVDSGNHRVLRYNAPLTTDAVADAVYGQPNFVSDTCNNGGISATTLCSPSDVAVDGAGRLFIADFSNGRVLGYLADGNTTADTVLGKPNFTTSSGNGPTASLMYDPAGVGVDSDGRLYVADYHNARVLIFEAPMSSDSIADHVIGQPDFTTASCAVLDPSTTCLVNRVTIDDAGNLFVSEWWRKAVLVYNRPLETDLVADGIIGKSNYGNFYSCNENDIISAASICHPQGVGIGPGDTLTVADGGNDRVLLYTVPTATDLVADRAIGQPDVWIGSSCNAGGISAGSLCVPYDAAVDGDGNVYISDLNNNRVLGYLSPLTTDYIADLVFGQNGSFTSSAFLPPTATTLGSPTGVAVDGVGNLYVSDALNNRILVFFDPFSTDATADHVFGQPNFTSGTANNGGISASSLWSPQGLRVDAAGNVFVVDLGNHRALAYSSPLTTDKVADRVFGQPNFTTLGCNTGGVGAATLCFPQGLAVDLTGALYVGDENNARVVRYDSALTSDSVADAVMGQPDFVSTTCNNGGVDADALCRPTGVTVDGTEVYIADRANHRVLRGTGFGTPVQVFGQLGSFTTTSFNTGGESARTLNTPRFVNTDALGRLYVADSANHRVLVFDTSADPDGDLIAMAADNCPTVYNPGQEQSDGNFSDQTPPSTQDDRTWPNSDATGDACDADGDLDNDGLTASAEAAGCSGSGPLQATSRDTDGDRFLDGAECAMGTDPNNAGSKPSLGACAASGDPDGDKIQSRVEVCHYNTDPNDNDTDDALDGLPAGPAKDGCEIASINGDRVVNAADQLLLANAITAPFYLLSMDINKDGTIASGDQLIMASLIAPPGQCP
jgi:sugar lactone lactonase YvrE